jgi:hypothetical protein
MVLRQRQSIWILLPSEMTIFLGLAVYFYGENFIITSHRSIRDTGLADVRC